MQIEPNPTTLRRDLRASLADGVCYSLMVGVGESYLPAFVLALGMGEVASGLVVAAPPIVGAMLQLASPAGVRLLRSQRRWVVACVTAQALSFLPLAAAALAGRIPIAMLFLVAAVYWGSGLAAGPAWNTWMGRIVPAAIRVRFFASRSRWMQVAQFSGLVAAGAALQAGERREAALEVFAGLFLAAGTFRFLSSRLLSRQSEPPLVLEEQRRVSLGELFGRLRHGREARLLLYMVALQVGVQMSHPYFAPYTLGELGFSYAQYMALVAVMFASKAALLPWLGLLAQRFGAVRLLWLAGVCMVLVPLAWIAGASFGLLVVAQILAGGAWAAYELSQLLLFFETIHEEERISMLTTFNVANSISMLTGSLAGGAILHGLGKDHGGYMILFALSAGLRAAAWLVWARRKAERGIRNPE